MRFETTTTSQMIERFLKLRLTAQGLVKVPRCMTPWNWRFRRLEGSRDAKQSSYSRMASIGTAIRRPLQEPCAAWMKRELSFTQFGMTRGRRRNGSRENSQKRQLRNCQPET